MEERMMPRMATESGGRPGASLASAAALPYLVMPLTNLCLSGFIAILRSVLRPSTGVSATTLFAYYQLLGSLLLSVLALLFESGRRPKLTFRILCSAFFVGFLQIPVGGLMLSSSLRYITTTFESVALNTIPSLVFVLAVLCRRERFRFWSVGGQAKLWGVVVSAAGAFAMVISDRDATESSASIGSSSHADWLLGTTMVGLGVAASAIADLSVESIAFRYPADLSLSAMIAVCGTLQTVTVAAFMERDASAWKIHRKGSLQLVAILYGVRTLPAYLVFLFFFFLYTPRDHVRRESLLRGCHSLEESGAYTGKAPSSRRHSPRCWWSSRSSSTRSSWEAPPTLEVFLQQRWSQRACIFFCGRSLRIKRWETVMRTSKLKGLTKNRCCERYPVWYK